VAVTRTDQQLLAEFCELLPDLIGSSSRQAAAAESALLREVTARLRAEEDLETTLLDFWRTLGELRGTRGPAVLGQDPAPPPPGSYRCPRDRCSRVDTRAPGGPLPECAVFDEPLRFGR
jgi:hypothetical protein